MRHLHRIRGVVLLILGFLYMGRSARGDWAITSVMWFALAFLVIGAGMWSIWPPTREDE